MKANAPEKIYIHPDIGGREFLRPWLHRPANNESIEYTRTDAFIEKACAWLKFKGGFTIGFPGAEIKDFKNYMLNESKK